MADARAAPRPVIPKFRGWIFARGLIYDIRASDVMMVILATLVLAAGFLTLDLMLPSGAGEWGLYLLPLLLSIRIRQPRYPYLLAGICSVFLIVGFLGSPTLIDRRVVAFDRLVGIAALWLTALLLVERRAAAQELRQNHERLGLIARTTAVVIGAAPLAEQIRKLAEQVRLAFDVHGCVIRILEDGELALLASAGIPESCMPPSRPVEWDIARTVFATRKPLFVADASGDSTMAALLSLMPEEHRFASCVMTPLLAQDRVIGIMGIFSKQRLETFPETDLEHLQIIANQIAVAIVNDQLFREVQSQKDQLGEQISVRKRMEEALQTLSRRLLELQEAERRHISRELHDEIGQALTALKINLQAMQRLPEAAPFATRLVDSIAIVDRTLRQVRNLSLDLRPSMLDDLGLSAALRWYADSQGQRAGLRVQFIGGDLSGRLDTALETACFRVAQEAMTNIVRHARATNVIVQLVNEGPSLHLCVCDDGVGFDPDGLQDRTEGGTSLGLLGMEERASLIGGRIELKSKPSEGTEVHAWFPLAPAQANGNAD